MLFAKSNRFCHLKHFNKVFKLHFQLQAKNQDLLTVWLKINFQSILLIETVQAEAPPVQILYVMCAECFKK